MKKILISFLSIIFLAYGINNENETKSATYTSVEVKEVSQEESASALLEKKIELWANQKGIKWGSSEDGKYFAYAVEEINVPIDDPKFGKKRVLAYEKAFLEAQKELVNYLHQDIKSNIIRKLFSDESLGIEDEDIRNREVLRRKLLKLSEAAIDNALKKLGVDPTEYGEITFEKKVDKFLDTIKRVSLVRAFGELTGSTIVYTVEGINKKGTYGVGVILMYSPKLKAFAKSFLYGEETYPIKKGYPIRYYLPDKPEEWLSSWGVRIIFNEKGEPVILSYGQWSYPRRKNSYINQRRRKHALRIASELASVYIAEFLNSKAIFESKSEIENTIREIEKKNNRELQEREEIDALVDKLWEKTKKYTRVKVSGIAKYIHKEISLGKHNFIIVVKYLSPQSMKSAIRLKQEYGKSKKSVYEENKTEKNYEQKVFESKDVTDINAW